MKDRENRFIGKKIPRKDSFEIVTGRALYVNDIKIPGMLYGKVVGSSYAHAIVKEIKKERALRVKGVKAILTYEDCPPHWKGGVPPVVKILDRKVKFIGDAVALIAAEREEAFSEAIDLLEIEYEPLKPVLSIDDALNPEFPKLYEEFEGNIVPSGLPAFGPTCLTDLLTGDVEEGFKKADVIVEGSVSYENIPNALPHETPAVIAFWEEPKRVTLWVSSQSPFREREIISRVLNGEVEVRVIGLRCGGSFGSRAMAWRWHCFAILLSRATGRPVKMVMSKDEQLATSVVRLGCRLEAKLGMKRDGTCTAISGRLIIDTGYYSRTTQAQVAVGLGELQIMVRCQNWDLRTKIVCTNRLASGQIRGFGGQEFKAVLMPIIYQALARLEIDPFEFLKKNFVKPGNGYFWRDGRWYTYRGIDFSSALERGAQVFGWREKWKGWLKPTSIEGNKRRGVGVAIHGNADIGEDASEVLLRLTPDGEAVLIGCIAEFGTGQKSNYAKMVAEVLKLPLEKVTVTPADSLFSPYVGPAGGSRGTYAIGAAVIKAAEDARERLLEYFSSIFETKPEELDTENGEVFLKAFPEKRLPWNSMGRDRTIIGFGRFEPDYTLTNCFMSFVEVEIDIKTGQISLCRLVNVTDVGRIIDPLGLEGQMNGCLGAAGIDSALFEETIIDKRTGQVLTYNLLDYKWRTFLELPKIENVILETPFPSHRFNAVGVGEITTSPGPAAVLMAASNAIGRWLNTYPLTPARILMSLKEG